MTHDQNEALSFASQVAVMRQGRFAQVGTPYEVYSRPVDEETALFLGDALVLPAELRGGRARCAIGEISIDDPHAVGQGRVMLRPEQLVISPSPADGQSLTVRDVDFSGHLSTLTLAMPGQGEPLIVKTVSRQLWRPGAAVRIEVVGEARVFAR